MFLYPQTDDQHAHHQDKNILLNALRENSPVSVPGQPAGQGIPSSIFNTACLENRKYIP